MALELQCGESGGESVDDHLHDPGAVFLGLRCEKTDWLC
jgi:hypothetical protein